MATYVRAFDIERLETAEVRQAMACEVRRGLATRPRSLSPWMFYDAEGSRLFECITTLPEYYPFRTEKALLAKYTDGIVASARGGKATPLRFVELGAGTAAKTSLLLEAALRVSNDVSYIPVDVSEDALEAACKNIARSLPRVRIRPMVRNYVTHPLRLGPFDGVTIALYIGTNIGNFSREDARMILRHQGLQLRSGDALLLGTDMVKDEATLVAAYDDSRGVTAAFNLNLLHRLNRELGADFDVARFRHVALWNSSESRMEMYLESEQEQSVRIEDAKLDLHFEQNETIHTENSYKFTDSHIQSVLDDAGFEIGGTWKDDRDWYTLTLACLR